MENVARFLFIDDESFSDEEDARVFEEINKERKVAEIRESIDELIEKGKKRSLKYEELMARREARTKRLMQLDEAKSWVLMHFARLFAVNRELTNPLTRALLLSLIPLDYNFQHTAMHNNHKSTNKLTRLLSQFNSLFISYLDPSLECLTPTLFSFLSQPPSNAGVSLLLSKIEYLLLFAMFVSFHSNLLYRVNFILDLAPMAHFVKFHGGKSIPAKQATAIAKVDDKYDYGMQKKIVKKRKYGDYFAERKGNLENEEKVVENQFKRFRLNGKESSSDDD